MPVLIEFALSTALVVTTAMLHGFGLLAIGRSVRALPLIGRDV